jgi:OOP family OmpA-OmpF porin
MSDLRGVRCFVSLALFGAALLGAASAQAQASGTDASFAGGFNLQRSHNPVGFNMARTEYRLPCTITVLHCQTSDVAPQYSRNWSLELGLQDLGRAQLQPWSTGRAQALNLSLMGKRSVFGIDRLNVYGKVGTSYGFTEPSGATSLAAGDSAVGLTYGAGLSMAFTPRLSATLAWDAHDFRFSSGGLRDVRATSIGLQYRY